MSRASYEYINVMILDLLALFSLNSTFTAAVVPGSANFTLNSQIAYQTPGALGPVNWAYRSNEGVNCVQRCKELKGREGTFVSWCEKRGLRRVCSLISNIS